MIISHQLREMLVSLIQYMCENYGRNTNITYLMDNTRIFLMPSMNPDGFELCTVCQ